MCCIPDFWLLGSIVGGRGMWLFSFCSVSGWRSWASPCARSGCRLCGLHLVGFLTLPLGCCLLLASCATSVLGKAPWCLRQQRLLCEHPLLPFGGTGLLCLGHMGTWKKQQGCALGFVPACRQPISTDAAACFRLVPQHLLSSSPWEGRTDKPSSIFTRGKWELLTAALGEAVWISLSVAGVGGEGDAGLLCSSIGGHTTEQESLPWASEQISSSSRNPRGFLSQGYLSLCSWQHCFIPSFSSQRYR